MVVGHGSECISDVNQRVHRTVAGKVTDHFDEVLMSYYKMTASGSKKAAVKSERWPRFWLAKDLSWATTPPPPPPPPRLASLRGETTRRLYPGPGARRARVQHHPSFAGVFGFSELGSLKIGVPLTPFKLQPKQGPP